MRKLATTTLIALGLVLLGAAPALASGGESTGSHGTLNVWCAPDKGTGVDIYGTLTIPNGSHDPVLLMLYGSKGSGWDFTSDGTVTHTVQGQTSYGFQFDAKLDGNHFNEYKVVGDDGTTSRIINRDECGFRVPEAPSSALLMLGALPVAGVVGMRVAGIRLPLPHWRRIA